MNLSQLYYFKKLAELQHYTRAAKELFITQPTLSDAMSSLEKELGVPLFRRDGRNVKLTPCGVEFNQYVRSSLRELDEGIAAMEQRKGELRGVISLGTTFTIQDDYLPALLMAYHEEYGANISIETYQGFTNFLTQCLHNETLDVAFCGRRGYEPDLVYRPILSRPLELAVRADHPFAGRKSVTFDDIKGERLITYRRGTPIGEQVQELLDCYPLPRIAQIYDDDITQASVLSTDPTLGALMLNSIGLKLFSDITTVPLEGVRADFYWVYLAYSKKHYQSKVVQSFVEFVERFEAEGVDLGAPWTEEE